jgi:hypothetical protein
MIQLLALILFSGCSQVINKPEKETTPNQRFRINDQGDTVVINYRKNGILLSEITIKNGMQNGLCLNYYENGNIQNEIWYKDGDKNGRATWNYESGKIYRESVYIDDEIEGIQKKYYEDGKLMAEIPYRKGVLLVGTKEYNKEGKLKKNYPEIIIEPVDKMAFENKYYLRASLTKNDPDAKFYEVKYLDGKKYDIPVPIKNGVAELNWFVPENAFIMEKVTVAVEYNTVLSNPVRLEKSFNLAADHR